MCHEKLGALNNENPSVVSQGEEQAYQDSHDDPRVSTGVIVHS